MNVQLITDPSWVDPDSLHNALEWVEALFRSGEGSLDDGRVDALSDALEGRIGTLGNCSKDL